MEKEFVPYELALELKQLGFDEPCLKWYSSIGRMLNSGKSNQPPLDYSCSAPTYSQAFRWFREKHLLHSRVFFDHLKELDETDEERYDFDIIERWTLGKDYYDYTYGFKHIHSSRGIYMSHEEAELECLKKLIEIVKEKQCLENL